MSDTAATYKRNRQFGIRLRGHAVIQLGQARTEEQETQAQADLRAAEQYGDDNDAVRDEITARGNGSRR